MTAEESFEKWWNENDDPDAPIVSRYLIAWAAYLNGRKAGMEEAAEITETVVDHLASPLAPFNDGVRFTQHTIAKAIRARMEGI